MNATNLHDRARRQRELIALGCGWPITAGPIRPLPCDEPCDVAVVVPTTERGEDK